jgi:hypothetical protein
MACVASILSDHTLTDTVRVSGRSCVWTVSAPVE